MSRQFNRNAVKIKCLQASLTGMVLQRHIWICQMSINLYCKVCKNYKRLYEKNEVKIKNI